MDQTQTHSTGEPGLTAHLHELQHETEALLTTLDRASNELAAAVRTQMERNPYAVLGMAAGVGYVLGGGLPSRLTRLLFMLGGRFGFEYVSRELSSRLHQESAGSDNGQQTDYRTKGNGS